MESRCLNKNIRIRQREGIALAKARGVYKGRKPIEIDKQDVYKRQGIIMMKMATWLLMSQRQKTCD